MFTVIYKNYVKKGREEDYLNLWQKIATYFKKERGAIGSCLHQGEDGLRVAYSRWPSRAQRDASWPLGEGMTSEIEQVIAQFNECIDEGRERSETCLELISNFL